MFRRPLAAAAIANSRSNAFPVGGITLPSGTVISPVKVPVALVTTVIQSPSPSWIGYGACTRMNRRLVDRDANDPALAVVAAPVELEPFQYFMVWRPRLDHDPAQQWLRDTIRSVAAVTVSGSRSRR